MTELATLKVEEPQPHTVLVTLNRPEVANAMNTQMGIDLLSVFDGFCARAERAALHRHHRRGTAHFCAGGDLKERNGMTDQQWQDQHLIFERAIRAIRDCPVPMIAAVNGAAFAGGMEIALVRRFHLRRRTRAVRADRGDAGHHARRRRHAEPAARRRGAAGQGDPADRAAVHRAAGVRVGHGQPPLRRRDAVARGAGNRCRSSPAMRRSRRGRSSSR